jgi:hypothetical protein
MVAMGVGSGGGGGRCRDSRRLVAKVVVERVDRAG